MHWWHHLQGARHDCFIKGITKVSMKYFFKITDSWNVFSFPKEGSIRFQGSAIVNDPFAKALSEKAAQLGHHGVQKKSFDQVNSAIDQPCFSWF